jgi:hypothetical protein
MFQGAGVRPDQAAPYRDFNHWVGDSKPWFGFQETKNDMEILCILVDDGSKKKSL